MVASVLVILDQADEARASTCAAAPSSSTRAQPDPAEARGHAEDDRPRDRDHPRARSTRSASPSPRSRASASDQIDVGLPDVQNAERAIDAGRDHRPALLLRLGGRTSSPTDARRPARRPSAGFHAPDRRRQARLEAEARVLPGRVHDQRARATTSSTQNTLRAARRPRADARPDLFLEFPRREAARRTRDHRGPAGHDRRRGAPQTTTRDTEADESETGPAGVLRAARPPGAVGDRHQEPRAELRPEDQPAERHLRLHRRGPRRRSRRSPRRSPSAAPPRRRPASTADAGRPVLGPLRDRARQRGRHRGRSSTSSRTRPGSTAAPGAQISGSFTIQEAQDLAEFLRIGALPIELKLISQSTVSATLGEEALDQGLKAGLDRADPRPALPDRLLPLPRRRRRRSACSSTRSSSSR